MQLGIKIKESSSEIKKLMLAAMKEECDLILKEAARKIKPQIKVILRQGIERSSAWQSLGGDSPEGEESDLQAAFGLRSSGLSERLNDLLDIWVDNVYVDYVPMKGQTTLKGKIIIGAVKSDWSDVLSNSAAYVETKIGQILPWLEWLLIRGDRTIIMGYDITFGDNYRNSRSGKAIMIKGKKWNVPRIFAGTTNNNFVTWVLDSLDESIVRIILDAFN